MGSHRQWVGGGGGGAVGGGVDQGAKLGLVDAHAAGDHGGDGARPILEHRLHRVGVVDPRLDRDQERSAKRVGVAGRQRPMISQAAAGPAAAACMVVARKYALDDATELREQARESSWCRSGCGSSRSSATWPASRRGGRAAQAAAVRGAHGRGREHEHRTTCRPPHNMRR